VLLQPDILQRVLSTPAISLLMLPPYSALPVFRKIVDAFARYHRHLRLYYFCHFFVLRITVPPFFHAPFHGETRCHNIRSFTSRSPVLIDY